MADGPRSPDTPGWRVRVVPNLYPAFERQEVVVHSPRHARSFAELADDELAATAIAWAARADAARAEGFGYLHACVNEGRAAGASLQHSHSQLVWLRDAPPAAAGEAPGGLRDLVRRGRETELEVTHRADVIAFCHPAGRLPYEMAIASKEELAPWPDGATLVVALEVLREAVQRLQRVEGLVPWNAWLHQGRDWHIELVPRLATLAGIELGAGIYVNTVAPEDAAAALRSAEAD